MQCGLNALDFKAMLQEDGFGCINRYKAEGRVLR